MTKEKDYQAAADWAEHDMTLKPGTTTALRGEAAAVWGARSCHKGIPRGTPGVPLERDAQGPPADALSGRERRCERSRATSSTLLG